MRFNGENEGGLRAKTRIQFSHRCHQLVMLTSERCLGKKQNSIDKVTMITIGHTRNLRTTYKRIIGGVLAGREIYNMVVGTLWKRLRICEGVLIYRCSHWVCL